MTQLFFDKEHNYFKEQHNLFIYASSKTEKKKQEGTEIMKREQICVV